MAISKISTLLLFLLIARLSSSSASNSTEFIRKSCNSTSFPPLCFASLAKYACAIQQSPLQLTKVATRVSLTGVKSAASLATSLYNKTLSNSTNGSGNNRTLKALKDCTDLLRDSADNTRYSLSQLQTINGTAGGGPEEEWKMSNVQTYMSAALTKEDTCTDGLKEMGAVVKDLSRIVGNAKKYTSNALGLVNWLRYGS